MVIWRVHKNCKSSFKCCSDLARSFLHLNYCSSVRHCNMKEFTGESASHCPEVLSDPNSVKGRTVYLESWLGFSTRCVQQVCGFAEKAFSQPQRCACAALWSHSAGLTEPAFFPSLVLNEGLAVFASPARLSSLPVCPTRSFLSRSLHPPPNSKGGCPMGTMSFCMVAIRTNSA